MLSVIVLDAGERLGLMGKRRRHSPSSKCFGCTNRTRGEGSCERLATAILILSEEF